MSLEITEQSDLEGIEKDHPTPSRKSSAPNCMAHTGIKSDVLIVINTML